MSDAPHWGSAVWWRDLPRRLYCASCDEDREWTWMRYAVAEVYPIVLRCVHCDTVLWAGDVLDPATEWSGRHEHQP